MLINILLQFRGDWFGKEDDVRIVASTRDNDSMLLMNIIEV